jgi:hypothetical protein
VNPSDALARHRISRARTALREADFLIQQQHFYGALNRVYSAPVIDLLQAGHDRLYSRLFQS